jgi:hypothetical protein
MLGLVATDGWGIVEALGSAAGGAVLVGGAFVAGFYGRKGTVTVEGTAHSIKGTTDGSFVLQVKASISAVGVLAVTLPPLEPNTKVEAVPLFDDAGVLVPGFAYGARHPFPNGAAIDGGETTTHTQLIPITPEDGMVGVRVDFLVNVPKKVFRTKKPWSWAASTYVSVP